MNDFLLIPALALTTLFAAILVGLWSKRKTDEKLDDPDALKSSLAKDGPGPQPFR
ncbi:hypothetical protein [Yoonia sp. SS1-5]|uniref:Uncharacterized protein n=1 Tax=Yoonia rhodophyticola TaxID=3137370 RepID=A0AAN0MIH4_9RHOB